MVHFRDYLGKIKIYNFTVVTMARWELGGRIKTEEKESVFLILDFRSF